MSVEAQEIYDNRLVLKNGLMAAGGAVGEIVCFGTLFVEAIPVQSRVSIGEIATLAVVPVVAKVVEFIRDAYYPRDLMYDDDPEVVPMPE